MLLPGVGLFGTGTLARIMVAHLCAHNFRLVAVWSGLEDENQRQRSLRGSAAPAQQSNAATGGEHANGTVANNNNNNNNKHSQQVPAMFADLGDNVDSSQLFFTSTIDDIIMHPEVQLIVVATGPHLHAQLVSKACHIGKHVVCNLPPALNIDRAQSMSRAATEYPSLIALAIAPLRSVPALSLMRQLVRTEGALGTVRFITATVDCDVDQLYEEDPDSWEQHVGGGLLSLFGVHLIDIITYVTGLRAVRVNAIVRKLRYTENSFVNNIVNAEDFVTFQLELGNATAPAQASGSLLAQAIERHPVVATVTLNGFAIGQAPKHTVGVYGTDGYLVFAENNLVGKLRSKVPAKARSMSSLRSSSPTMITPETTFYLDHNETRGQINSQLVPPLHQLGFGGFVTAIHRAFNVGEAKRRSLDSISTRGLDTSPGNRHDTQQQQPQQQQQQQPRERGKVVKSASAHCFNGYGQAGTKLVDQRIHHAESLMLEEPEDDDSMLAIDDEVGSGGGTDVHKNEEKRIAWSKEAVAECATFGDALYVQATVDAIRLSAQRRQWIRVEMNPNDA